MGHLPGSLRGVGRVPVVAVAEQRAAEVAEKGMHVTVRARARVVEHHLVGIAVHRPQPPGAHLALRLATGLERGLVHRQYIARQYMGALRLGDRRQQVDGAARPVNQGGAAERDAGVEKTPMLAIDREMPAELVDQHRGEEAHVGARALQHVRRRRGGDNGLGVAALDDLAHVLQHHVAARLLRKAIAHLLADDLALGLRNRFNRRVSDLDGLHRHLGTEAQSAVRDRRIAHLRATLVAHRLARHIVARGGLSTPSPASRLSCTSSSRSKRFSDFCPKSWRLNQSSSYFSASYCPCNCSSAVLVFASTAYASPSATPSRAFSSSSWATSGADNFRLALASTTYAIYQLSNHSGSLPVALPVA